MIAPLWSRMTLGIAPHPPERTLHRFADDELSPSERQRTAAHLLECARCRAVVADVRALGDAARGHDAPMPDLATLRERVIARRAAGDRVIVSAPHGAEDDSAASIAAARAPRSWRPGPWHALAAAGLVGVLAGASGVGALWEAHRRAERSTVPVVPAAAYAALDLVGGSGCMSGDPDGGHPIANATGVEGMALQRLLADAGLATMVPFVGCHTVMPVAPPVDAFDASRVRPMAITYHARTVVDTISIENDDRTFTLARSTLNGRAAWSVTGHTEKYPLVSKAADSLYLSATDLRPLRQVSFGSHGAQRMRIDLTGDAGIMHLDGYRARSDAPTTPFDRPVALVRQPGATIGPAPVEAILPALPLRDGWTGSVDVLAPQCLICSMRSVGWPGVSFTNLPLVESLRVEGTDRVVVAGGSFDCWRIRVTGGIADGSNDRGVHTIWASKDAHVIVKDVISWTDADGIRYQRTRELTRLSLGAIASAAASP